MKINDALGNGNLEEFDPGQWDLTGDFLYLGNKNHIRQYSGL